MKTRQIFSAFLTGTISLCLGTQAHAQDPMVHITGPVNTSLNYMPSTNRYVLSGQINPATIGGWSNAATFGFLPRIQLQVLNNPMLATSLYKTYVTAQELMDVQDHRCTTLAVAFHQVDAKQTADKGFILCGYVERTSEYSSCQGPTYCNPYLIKTDMNGNVMWYKRYNTGYDNRTRFYSVVEDVPTGNFIVCGETVPAMGIMPMAFMMGTDFGGNIVWSHTTMTTRYNDPMTPESSTYTEVTPYTDLMGMQYYVLTGKVGYSFYYPYGVNTGGGLLTVVNANGVIFNNRYLTEDHVFRFMQLTGVHDAHDGDVVLTGFSGVYNCGSHDGFNLLLMKINPLTLVTSFMESFEINPGSGNMYDQSFGKSVTVTSNAVGPRIAVTGYDDNAGYYGLYLETDYLGNLLRYTQHNAANVTSGSAVVFNTTNNHTVYSGWQPNGTVIIKDKYGFACDPDSYPAVLGLVNTDVVNTTISQAVTQIAEPLMAFNMTTPQVLACGAYKPGNTTPEEVETATTKNMLIMPNPAASFIDVQLANTLSNGTVQVYDMVGRLVMSGKTDEATSAIRLDVQTLTSGVYTIIAAKGSIKEHSTFVKQ